MCVILNGAQRSEESHMNFSELETLRRVIHEAPDSSLRSE
jgi:hypothetical protein